MSAVTPDQPSVLILAGGLSHEREVSLASGKRVARELTKEGYSVREVDLDAALIKTLQDQQSVVVFPVLHGEIGEDGSIREVLDLLDVSYIGAEPQACRMTFDKSISNPVLADHGLRVPKQYVLPHDIFRELGASALISAVGRKMGFPLIIKPSRSGSALGTTKVDGPDEVPAAMVNAYAYGSVAVIEEFIIGTEVAVSVVDLGDGPRALPPIEMRPDSGVYDYASRYTPGATRFIIPAEISPSADQAARDVALQAHLALGLRDVSRADIIVTPDGEAIIFEVNVAPGMTETSLLPLAIDAGGLSFGEVCATWVQRAARRKTGSTLQS